ncbi:MAG: YiiX/YebB-like N1pC/P60 family cysteine hydrolase [Cetobacterium sp.]
MIYILFVRLFSFLFLFTIIGCSNNSDKYIWQNSQTAIFNSHKLQQGDIIIKNKLFSDPLSWLGHSSIMINSTHIGDFPMPGKNYYTITANSWLNEKDRKIIVLRYKNFNDIFKQQFSYNIKKYGSGKYRTSFFKKNDKDFYCSKFVWFLFYKTAKDLNYHLDLDDDGGLIIFPFDFIGSNDLEQIIL